MYPTKDTTIATLLITLLVICTLAHVAESSLGFGVQGGQGLGFWVKGFRVFCGLRIRFQASGFGV